MNSKKKCKTKKIKKVMEEFKEGSLKIKSGKIVKDPK